MTELRRRFIEDLQLQGKSRGESGQKTAHHDIQCLDLNNETWGRIVPLQRGRAGTAPRR